MFWGSLWEYYRGKFLPTIIHTLRQSFSHVYLISDKDFYEYIFRNTYVIVATDNVLDMDEFEVSVSKNADRWIGLYVHDEVLLDKYIAEKKPIVLTDDYAPTDSLVAPLYSKKY